MTGRILPHLSTLPINIFESQGEHDRCNMASIDQDFPHGPLTDGFRWALHLQDTVAFIEKITCISLGMVVAFDRSVKSA